MRGLAAIVAILGYLALAVSQEVPPEAASPEPAHAMGFLKRNLELFQGPGFENVDTTDLDEQYLPYDHPLPAAPEGMASAPQGPRKCLTNVHCAPYQGCSEGHCVDPCQTKPCGDNTFCEVENHVPNCICDYGFEGDPALGCTIIGGAQCTKDDECGEGISCSEGECIAKACLTKKCGDNAFCEVDANGVAACLCSTGFIADETSGCLPPPPAPMSAPTPGGIQFAEGGYNNCSGRNFPQPRGKKAYYVVTSAQMNWHNAYMYCIAHGRRLATVENEKENLQILQAIKETGELNKMFYTSGNDYVHEQRFMWMTTGLPITDFTYWHANRPIYYAYSNCIAYYQYDAAYGNIGYKWWDEICTNKHFFICEDYVRSI